MRGRRRTYRWLIAIKLIESILLRLVARVRVEGAEHIPRSGQYIVAVNHLSILDGALFALLVPGPIAIFGAAEWVERPWVKPFLLVGGPVIAVRRGEADGAAIANAIETLHHGTSVLITPEGRVSRGATLGRGRSGIVRIATAAEVPVVPLAFYGQERMASRLRHMRRADITLRFGPPLCLDRRMAASDNVDRVMRSIAQLLPPAYGGTRDVDA